MAIEDQQFLASLYKTLQAWGIGVRASQLKPFGQFCDSLRDKIFEISELDNTSIDDPALHVGRVGEKLWHVLSTLDIVNNKTRIVSGSKALHHLLPDLVVPVDRAYTQKFFSWQSPKFQYDQPRCFAESFAGFVLIARQAGPEDYISPGWNSSRTKIIDNAIVGMVLENAAANNGASEQRRPHALPEE